MFSFVLTFYAYDWFARGGIKRTMIIIGSIQVGICLLSVPMCEFTRRKNNNACSTLSDLILDVFGKWNRSFFARHDIFKKLNL